MLNSTLATTVDLKAQPKQAQWNVVTGNNCEPLQELYADMATELEEYTDIFAEQLKALGGLALAIAKVAAERSALPEYPGNRVIPLCVYLTMFKHKAIQPKANRVKGFKQVKQAVRLGCNQNQC